MIYRDDQEALRARRNELAVARMAELMALPRAAIAVLARRATRIAWGIVGVPGTALMGLCAPAGERGATFVLIGTWVAVAVTAEIAAALAPRHIRRQIHRAYTPSDDVLGDIERLETPVPAFVAGRAKELERASAAWPLIA